MTIKMHTACALVLAAILGPLALSIARADEEKALRPEIAQLTQTVSDKAAGRRRQARL